MCRQGSQTRTPKLELATVLKRKTTIDSMVNFENHNNNNNTDFALCYS